MHAFPWDQSADKSAHSKEGLLTKQSRETVPPVSRQQNFHRVVYGNDSEYIPRLIDDGKRQQIVLGNSLCNFSRRLSRISSLKLRPHHVFERH
jgi:hypothetical protein